MKGYQMTTEYVLAAARQLRDDVLIRQLERDIAWAEHLASAMDVIAPDPDITSVEVSEA